jgi:hypothetical protein
MPYEEPPGCITCPITGTLFVHPVLLPDGWTYETCQDNQQIDVGPSAILVTYQINAYHQ